MHHRFILLLLFVFSPPAFALETDQYTPPPRPLRDLGGVFDREVESILREVVEQTHRKRELHLRRTPRWPQAWREHHLEEAEAFLSESHIARAAFMALSRGGTPQNRMEAFFRYGEFEEEQAIYRVRAGDSIYGSFKRPLTIQNLSPTIHLYGVYLGTDKLGHFFEQGHEYYEVFFEEMARTGDSSRALRKAIERGVKQEKTYYGMMVDGVYSNADLAANYAGLLFYLNLTRPVVIDGVKYEPVLVVREKRWVFNRGPLTLRPFVTDHWNEAMNPSRFSRSVGEIVEARFRGMSDRWLAFYGRTREEHRRRMDELSTFFGSSYGHAAPLKPTL